MAESQYEQGGNIVDRSRSSRRVLHGSNGAPPAWPGSSRAQPGSDRGSVPPRRSLHLVIIGLSLSLTLGASAHALAVTSTQSATPSQGVGLACQFASADPAPQISCMTKLGADIPTSAKAAYRFRLDDGSWSGWAFGDWRRTALMPAARTTAVEAQVT